jgi:hypothetical protein
MSTIENEKFISSNSSTQSKRFSHRAAHEIQKKFCSCQPKKRKKNFTPNQNFRNQIGTTPEHKVLNLPWTIQPNPTKKFPTTMATIDNEKVYPLPFVITIKKISHQTPHATQKSFDLVTSLNQKRILPPPKLTKPNRDNS